MKKLLGWILIIPIFLIVGGIAFTEINKAYWDHKIKEWCKKDGGVTVYEHIELTQDELKAIGGSIAFIRAPDEEYAKKNDIYISTFTSDTIRDRYPIVNRYETKFFIRSNKKLLASQISYGRIDGDFPTGIIHPSSFSCNEIKSMNMGMLSRIFSIKGEIK